MIYLWFVASLAVSVCTALIVSSYVSRGKISHWDGVGIITGIAMMLGVIGCVIVL